MVQQSWPNHQEQQRANSGNIAALLARQKYVTMLANTQEVVIVRNPRLCQSRFQTVSPKCHDSHDLVLFGRN